MHTSVFDEPEKYLAVVREISIDGRLATARGNALREFLATSTGPGSERYASGH